MLEYIRRGAGDDSLTGDSSNNRLDGRGGRNVFVGGDGNDTTLNTTGAGGIFGVSGKYFNAIVYSSATLGIVVGKSSNTSRLFATDGLGGTDLIINADRIIGSANDDVFTITDNWNGSRFSGFDASGVGQVNTNTSIQIRGGAGNDTINGNGVTILDVGDEFSGVTVVFNAGGSRVFGDLLIGDGSANTLSGLGGDDMLVGASGDASLNGGLGAAFSQGGSENDTLAGGSDSDIFQYIASPDSSAGAGDTIADFDVLSETELIFLDGLLSGNFQTGISAGGKTGFVAILDGSNDTKVEIDTDGDGLADMESLLLDVVFGDLDATDFLATYKVLDFFLVSRNVI